MMGRRALPVGLYTVARESATGVREVLDAKLDHLGLVRGGAYADARIFAPLDTALTA